MDHLNWKPPVYIFCLYTNYNHLMQIKNWACCGTGMLSSRLCWGHPNNLFLWCHHTTVWCALLNSYVHDRHFLSLIFLCETVKVKLSPYGTFEPQHVEAHRISRHSAHDGGKVVSPVHRPPLLPKKYSLYSFLLGAESTAGP